MAKGDDEEGLKKLDNDSSTNGAAWAPMFPDVCKALPKVTPTKKAKFQPVALPISSFTLLVPLVVLRGESKFFFQLCLEKDISFSYSLSFSLPSLS